VKRTKQEDVTKRERGAKKGKKYRGDERGKRTSPKGKYFLS